jgi:hypothetical protein
MGLTITGTSGGGNFIQVPPGMHLARCYRIIDLGTQKSTYMGKERQLHKVMVQFEIHGENDKGEPLQTSEGKPLILSKTYTASNNEKSSLVADLQTWRGKAFSEDELKNIEIRKILGQWGMLSVVESQNNGNTYTNIASINPVPASIKKAGLPEGVNEPKIFDLDEFDQAFFDSLSDGIKNKIKLSPEYERVHGSSSAAPASFDDMSDDIPF